MSLKVHVNKVYTDNLASQPDISISQLVENLETCICRLKFRDSYAYCFFLDEIKVANDLNEIVHYPLSSEITTSDTLILECHQLKSVDKM
jgi:hypothetical protein